MNFFQSDTHAAPRRIAGPAVLAITLASVVGGGYQFPRRCDPPILPTTIKRLLSSNVYGYSAVITCLPGLAARLSRMDTAKANFTPDAFCTLCARPATFITTISTCKNDLRLFMLAREINIYTIRTEYDEVKRL